VFPVKEYAVSSSTTHPEPVPTRLRPPGDGECQFCGAQPAARVGFMSLISAAIFYSVAGNRGWLCRTCGLAVYRRHTNRTLAGGWWGVTATAIPIFLVANRIRLGRVLRLAPPQPTPGVAAFSPVPLDPGKPVLRRPGAIVAIVVLVFAVLSVTLFVWAVASAPVE
jgi:hypothetical protein